MGGGSDTSCLSPIVNYSCLGMLPIPNRSRTLVALAALSMLAATACSDSSAASAHKTIVVTYSILGAVVQDLVGSAAEVVVMIPNGADPHEWEPSARDIERLNHADLIVRN